MKKGVLKEERFVLGGQIDPGKTIWQMIITEDDPGRLFKLLERIPDDGKIVRFEYRRTEEKYRKPVGSIFITVEAEKL